MNNKTIQQLKEYICNAIMTKRDDVFVAYAQEDFNKVVYLSNDITTLIIVLQKIRELEKEK